MLKKIRLRNRGGISVLVTSDHVISLRGPSATSYRQRCVSEERREREREWESGREGERAMRVREKERERESERKRARDEADRMEENIQCHREEEGEMCGSASWNTTHSPTT